MKTNNIITFNPFTGKFTVNNEMINTTLISLSQKFYFKKYLLYHLAYRLYKKQPWVYDLKDGDELLSLQILGIALEKADNQYRLTVNEMVKTVYNFPALPTEFNNITGLPKEGISVMRNIIDKLSGFGLLDCKSQGEITIIKGIFTKLYYICYGVDKSTQQNWTDWLSLSIDIIRRLCKDYENNTQLINNIMDREFEKAKKVSSNL